MNVGVNVKRNRLMHINPFTLRATKTGLAILKIFRLQNIFWKTLEGAMLTRSQTRSPLQIFWEFLLNSKVIFKSMRIADDTFKRSSECEWVKN